jgi:hypothetical protein
VRNLVEDLLLVGIKGEEGQILRIEQAQNVFVKVEQNLVEIAGGVNLIRDAFDVFRDFVSAVGSASLSSCNERGPHGGRSGRRPLAAVAQLPHGDKSRLSLAQQDGKARKRRFHDARRRTT